MNLVGEDGFILNSTVARFEKSEKDTSQIWLENFIKCARTLLADSRANPIAVCISGNGPTLVALDSQSDKSFTYLWNAKAIRQAEDLGEKFEIASIFMPRILQFKADYPDIFENANKIISGPEFLIYRLTDSKAVTILPEKRFTNAYWNLDILKNFNLKPQIFPDFVPCGYKAGNLSKDMLSALNLKSGLEIPVFCGGPDFVTALIGTGTIENGKICDRSGSSEGINFCSNNISIYDKKNVEKIRLLPSAIENLWNKSVLIPDSGSRFTMWKKNSSMKDLSYHDCLLSLLDGNSTDTDEILSGKNIIDSIMKDVKQAFDIILSEYKLESNSNIQSEIICSGGQAKNSAWMQYKAEKLGLKLCVTNCADSELTGCAILALTSLGNYSNIQAACHDLIKIEHIYRP
ncbi:MAG: hypothetical protein K5839_02420 [Treponemataceae bacterium]|nr:hypothetical protein [Treponemataceae bacterium]